MKKTNSGRPPKFNEESSPITVTLPRRILKKLERVDLDRAKAIVKCVENVTDLAGLPKERVYIARVTDDTGLIVVPSSKSLRSIPWLQLIEITPDRYLLAVPTGTSIESLEIAIMDLIERLPDDEIAEKTLLTDLRHRISYHRRGEEFTKGEILFVKTSVQKPE
jgi:hypothetical protein